MAADPRHPHRGRLPGYQFGISEISVDDYSTGTALPVPIVHRTVLPATPAGAQVRGWDLGQELPGRAGCADGPDRVHCSGSLVLPPRNPARSPAPCRCQNRPPSHRN
ncbi:hypothetical protein ACQ86I_18270 [Prescottella equi]